MYLLPSPSGHVGRGAALEVELEIEENVEDGSRVEENSVVEASVDESVGEDKGSVVEISVDDSVELLGETVELDDGV